MNNSVMFTLLATMATLLALAGCVATNSQALLLPTALTCPACPTVGVTRAVDGDTLDTTEGPLRLFGVDTPERREKCYREATKRLRELAGKTVRVEAGPRARDPSGRSLWYVYTDAGDSIDEVLIREGLGLAWTRDGQYRDYLVEVETIARRQGVGCLW